MAQRADVFELAPMRLEPGQARQIDGLEVVVEPFAFGGQTYTVAGPVPVLLDVSRMIGGGYALRLRLSTALQGPCMRCLRDAAPIVEVDAREVHQEGEAVGDDLISPYVSGEVQLDLHAWARDAVALAMPLQVLCRPDCPGLCPECGADLADDPGHHHDPGPDPRWAKLGELKFE